MNNIDKQNPTPLYFQIANEIKSQIISGALSEGDKIPPESWYCEKYNVSRATIRKAIESLISANIIERIKGTSPTVKAKKIDRSLSTLTGLHEELHKLNISTRSEIIAEKRLLSNAFIAEKMHLSGQEDIMYVNRIRFADEKPLSEQLLYIRTKYCISLNPKDLENKSFYSILEDDYGLKISHADQIIDAIAPSMRQVAMLGLNGNESLLRMCRTTYLSNGDIIEYNENYYAPWYKYSIKLYR